MHHWFGLSWIEDDWKIWLHSLNADEQSVLTCPSSGFGCLWPVWASLKSPGFSHNCTWPPQGQWSLVMVQSNIPIPSHTHTPLSNKKMLQHLLVYKAFKIFKFHNEDQSPLASQWSRLLCWGTDAAAWQVSIHWSSNESQLYKSSISRYIYRITANSSENSVWSWWDSMKLPKCQGVTISSERPGNDFIRYKTKTAQPWDLAMS